MPSMMTGTFKLIKSHNYKEYLEAIGVYPIIRKDFTTPTKTPTVRITNEGDEWIIRCTNRFTVEIKFKLGEEFTEATPYIVSCKSVITQEGDNKLVHVQTHDTLDPLDNKLTIIREFTDTEMTVTLIGPDDVVATRIYQKQ